MIVLTPAAAEQVLHAASLDDNAGLALRVAARRHADGGIEYAMGFDRRRDEDRRCTDEGVELLVDEDSEELLGGTVLDFVEYQPGDFRFIFIPPPQECPADAPAKCGGGGCGSCGTR